MSFTPQQCGGIQALQFDLNNFDRYDEFFNENSTMALAQAGVYTGPAQMAEYFGFSSDQPGRSPYLDKGKGLNRTFDVVGFDPFNGICTFVALDSIESNFSSTYTAGCSARFGGMIKIVYSIPDNVVTKVSVYLTPAWNKWFFGTCLGEGDNTNGYVCDILASDGCRDIYELNGSPSRESCIEQLNTLDIVEGDLAFFDGRTRGCRYLHATFAEDNPDHCAHISFTPTEDSNGKIKCQESENIAPDSLFSAQEIAMLEQFCAEQPTLNYSEDCVFVLAEPNITTDSPTMSPTDDTSGAALVGHSSPFGLVLMLTTMALFSLKLW